MSETTPIGTTYNNLSLSALITALDDAVYLVNEQTVFLDVWTSNPNLLFAPKETLIGKNLSDFFSENSFHFESILKQAIKLNQPLSTEFQHPEKDLWFSAKITPIPAHLSAERMVVFVLRDITDKIISEKIIELERTKTLAANKMATLGEMAAGIAHEINNPLAIIQSKAWLLSKQLDGGTVEPVVIKETLNKISETVERISKIIKGLKTFARNAEKDPFEIFDLQTVALETLELCKERFKNHNVELKNSIKKGFQIEGRSVQLSQVLLNLLSNAFDAVEKLPTPWVEVSCKDFGDYIELYVTDCGHGIPIHLVHKIMNPFFTTKDAGKGTGLGLSITKGIVEDHGGQFFIDRNFAHTRFVARLPKLQSKPLAFAG